MTDPRFERPNPLSQAQVEALEKHLGRALPEDFRAFLKTYAGSFVGGLVDGDRDLDIDAFDDFEQLMRNSYLTELWEMKALRFGYTILNNIWVLDSDNAVHYLDFYGRRTGTRRVADTFGDFLARVVPDEDDR